MMTYENVRKALETMEAQRSQMSVQDVITAHLQSVAAQLPEGKFPSGLTVEDTVSIILDTAKEYVTARDQQMASGKTLTAQEIREKIGGNLSKVTREQAVDYLARLQLVYKYMAPGAAAEVTAEDLEAEYTQLKMSVASYPLDEQVEKLVDGLAVEQVDRFLNMADVAQEDVRNNADITATVQNIKAKDLDAETAAIAGAALYGEVALGHIPDLAPETNPGIVTAKAAAAADTLTTAIQTEQGELTEEQAAKKLGWISKALAVALSVAVMAVLVALALFGVPQVMIALLGKGTFSAVMTALGWMLSGWVIMDERKEIYHWSTQKVHGLMKLYNKASGAVRGVVAKQTQHA